MKRVFFIIAAIALSLLLGQSLTATVRLPAVLSDGMVIQRDRPAQIWGWADAGEKVKVEWMGRQYKAVASEEGEWSVILPATPAGGPYEMKVGDTVVRDILVGDVYLCSGQSNMELPVARVTDMFAQEIASYENDMIRHFTVPKEVDFEAPAEDFLPAGWLPTTQENVMQFSALAYFYAKALYEQTGVPVGIVNASWGGTPVQSWMSEGALKDFPKYLNEKQLYENDAYREHIKKLEGENYYWWNTVLDRNDPGLNGEERWYSERLDDSGWKQVDMFSDQWGNDGVRPLPGSHWLRKEFDLPDSLAGSEAVLRLGCIVDADSAYVNGQFVGNITYMYPPRIYDIPQGVLKAGRNVVAVRVISNGGQPSFVPEKPYKVICGGQEFSLEGKWKYRPGAPMPNAPTMMFYCYKPVCLYNAMIAPLARLGFAGVLWYQGESNVDNRDEYPALLTSMIADWRQTFDDPLLPFFIVELADFLHPSDISGRQAWAEMRQMQAKAAQTNTRTYLVPNSDLGEWNDVHPLDKKTLAGRAAAITLQAAGENQ